MKLGTSILITSLNKEIGQVLSSQLANVLGMHYADCKELIEYDLFDSGAILQKCGIEYLTKRERSVIRDIATYENSVIFVEYDIYKNNYELLRKIHPSIYLKCAKRKLSKTEPINEIAFEDRDKFLSDNCDLVIEVNSASKSAFAKIIKEINQKL